MGFIRLIYWLATDPSGLPCPTSTRYNLVVDSGTGVTAIGLALGIALLDLPWRVSSVMLAGSLEYYQQQQHDLLAAFSSMHPHCEVDGLPLDWVSRMTPRKFGSVLPGDIQACKKVAQRTGIILDPISSLAAWEISCQLANTFISEVSPQDSHNDSSVLVEGVTGVIALVAAAMPTIPAPVVMLHSGGMEGLHGLAQRFPTDF